MNKISCYCNNGGYITTASGEEIAVCFEKTNSRITCKKIKVYGHKKVESRQSGENDPCPSGSMEIFSVEKYECK